LNQKFRCKQQVFGSRRNKESRANSLEACPAVDEVKKKAGSEILWKE
jgi:hypothetical protein